MMNIKNNREWREEVIEEKRKILASKRDDVTKLIKVFELCQDDFDIIQMEEKYPEYYRILKELTKSKLEKSEELFANSQELLKFFKRNKEEMRKIDIDLYYAVLGFVDFLKCKHLYKRME